MKSKVSKPCTKLQTLAQQENYAIFQLKGMLGNIVHVRGQINCDGLVSQINYHISEIKVRQYYRKLERKKTK